VTKHELERMPVRVTFAEQEDPDAEAAVDRWLRSFAQESLQALAKNSTKPKERR